MKKLDPFWKILIVSTTLLIVIFIYYKGRKYYDSINEYYFVLGISEKCELIHYTNEDVRVRVRNRGPFTSPRLNWLRISDENDSLAIFDKNGKRGYLNINTGKIVIPAKYQQAWFFSEGIAAVCLNSKIGFINTKGEILLDFKFTYIPQKNKDINFTFKNGLCAVADSTQNMGIIDIKGNWVLQPTYSNIELPVKNYGVVSNENYSGVIDSSFNLVLPIKYNRIKVREDGFLIVTNSTQQLLDFDGKRVLNSFLYDDSYVLFYKTKFCSYNDSSINKRTNYYVFEINDKKGLLNNKGEIIAPAKYRNINSLGPELFTCQIDNEWITINGKGEEVNNN